MNAYTAIGFLLDRRRLISPVDECYNCIKNKFGKYHALATSDDKKILVCLEYQEISDYTARTEVKVLSDYEKVKTELYSFFNSLGLWDEESFGIWTIVKETDY